MDLRYFLQSVVYCLVALLSRYLRMYRCEVKKTLASLPASKLPTLFSAVYFYLRLVVMADFSISSIAGFWVVGPTQGNYS